MDQDCRLAGDPSEITAQHSGGALVISAHGESPSSCWKVSLHRSLLTVWPPEFSLEECQVGDVCREVLTPYTVVQSFTMADAPESIVVHSAGGPRTVQVDRDGVAASVSGDAAVGSALGTDFGQALARAANGVSPGPGTLGRTVTVEEIWYSDGGVVGPQIHVRVKRRTAGNG